VELVPGILLLHTHSDTIETTTVLIGAGDWAWTLPGCATPARLVLALVSSRDQSPGRHLKILSNLARALRDSALRERMDSGLSAADMAAALRGFLSAESD
jgi:mannitol/fructose-specific phosphotransferase system IIA component (Ntr-type)